MVQHGHSRRLGPPGARCRFPQLRGDGRHIRDARVVVTHAGVGSAMVSLANGKRPVVVPRRKSFAEAVDDHQLQLGRRLARRASSHSSRSPPDSPLQSRATTSWRRSCPRRTPSLPTSPRFYSARIKRRRRAAHDHRVAAEGLGRHPRPERNRLEGSVSGDGAGHAHVVALVLARLLTPEDWGLAAMVVAFAGFAVAFTDNAFGTALIQQRQLVEEDKSTVFWVSAGTGPGPRGGGDRGWRGRLRTSTASRRCARCSWSSASASRQLTRHDAEALLVREMQFRRLELRQIAASSSVGCDQQSRSRCWDTARGRSSAGWWRRL